MRDRKVRTQDNTEAKQDNGADLLKSNSPPRLRSLCRQQFSFAANDLQRDYPGGCGTWRSDQAQEEVVEKPKPAFRCPSIQNDYQIYLKTASKFKSLTRHLMSHVRSDAPPEQYAEKWELPADYPIGRSSLPSALAPCQGNGPGA